MSTGALCDVCDTRPGVATIIAYGIETFVCDQCRGVEQESKNVEVMGRMFDYFLGIITKPRT